MSLIDHLMKREKLDLAKELARTARENAVLRDEIGKRDVELFWMKVAERDAPVEQQTEATPAANRSTP
jgi:hypothetical protein